VKPNVYREANFLVVYFEWSKFILFWRSYLPFVGLRCAQRQPTTHPKPIIPDPSHYQWPNLALSSLRRYGDGWRITYVGLIIVGWC
jgi:hypothetical protein